MFSFVCDDRRCFVCMWPGGENTLQQGSVTVFARAVEEAERYESVTQ